MLTDPTAFLRHYSGESVGLPLVAFEGEITASAMVKLS